MNDRGNAALRKLDLCAGVPLVIFLKLFRFRKKRIPASINRIAVLSTAALGDTLLHSVLLNLLKKHYPKAELILICGSSNKAMAPLIHPEKKILEIPVNQPVKSVKAIRNAGHFDLLIDTGPWPRINSILSFFSKSACLIGFRTAGQARHFLYDIALEHRSDRHEMENILSLLEPLGIKEKGQPDLSHFFPRNPIQNQLLFHMFPGGYLSHFKEWSSSNWISLLNYYTGKGYRIYLSGAPVDKDRADSIRQNSKDPDKIEVLAGNASLKECCQKLSTSRAIVTVNTGIMHLAAAIQVPMIALHGPTSVKRWGPLSSNAVSLEGTSPSSGILNLGFEYDKKDPHSVDTITVDQCIYELNKLLKKDSI